jgi:cytoplasmic iron level regulating protein YaaA (DUF328/UPF0246 family)
VLILLPPSESKTGRQRGGPVRHERLSFPELTETRQAVADALAKVSAHPDAAQTLGVSPNLTADIARNLVLHTAPALPASRVYSGVLYDALAQHTLDAAARRRANRWLVVVSALYGAVRPTDSIAPYRLSMAVSLPGLGPLASVWKPDLAPVLADAAGRGLVVDCRSSTYAAAWSPQGDLADRWVQVRVPGAGRPPAVRAGRGPEAGHGPSGASRRRLRGGADRADPSGPTVGPRRDRALMHLDAA